MLRETQHELPGRLGPLGHVASLSLRGRELGFPTSLHEADAVTALKEEKGAEIRWGVCVIVVDVCVCVIGV